MRPSSCSSLSRRTTAAASPSSSNRSGSAASPHLARFGTPRASAPVHARFGVVHVLFTSPFPFGSTGIRTRAWLPSLPLLQPGVLRLTPRFNPGRRIPNPCPSPRRRTHPTWTEARHNDFTTIAWEGWDGWIAGQGRTSPQEVDDGMRVEALAGRGICPCERENEKMSDTGTEQPGGELHRTGASEGRAGRNGSEAGSAGPAQRSAKRSTE
eukprot:scaffold786_cov329-Pavlova_lutheri.AAC.12